jgi:hypothetical protein
VIHWQVIIGNIEPEAIPIGYLVDALYGTDYPRA